MDQLARLIGIAKFWAPEGYVVEAAFCFSWDCGHVPGFVIAAQHGAFRTSAHIGWSLEKADIAAAMGRIVGRI